jgi:hypothetical protein
MLSRARLLAVAVVLAGCTAGPPVATPTPRIIVVTPTPAPTASPSPSPVSTPTATPTPTTTAGAGDLAVAHHLLEASTKIEGLFNDLVAAGSDVGALTTALKALRTAAEDEVTWLASVRASTSEGEEAIAGVRGALDEVKSAADEGISILETGGSGGEAAGAAIATAVASLFEKLTRLLKVNGFEIVEPSPSSSTAGIVVEGRATQKTEPFELAAGEYDLTWEVETSETCNLLTSLASPEDDTFHESVASIDPGSGTETGKTVAYNVPAGRYYFDVFMTGDCTWRFGVQRR